MNEAPSNQTGGMNDTFSSQPSQTNPFTADLKGEFTSNFGTNTNAVSQIFKEGGFASGNNKTKYMIIGGVALVVIAIVFFVMTMGGDDNGTEVAAADGAADTATEDGEDDAKADDTKVDKDAKDDKDTAADTKADAKDDAKADDATKEVATKVPASVPHGGGGGGGANMGSGKVTLTEPADGSSLTYDESQGAAVFNWTGGGGHIIFSRNQSMNPPAMKMRVNGNSFSFQHPWPGTWYWKVENASGSTEVRSFKVSGPQRRAVQLTTPTSGGAVAGSGGTVTWQGDSKVAYYRVELSTGGWANPQFRFASSGNSVTLNGVTPGAYQMRVGAFSEVSGRWEFSTAVPVTVQ